MLRGNIVIATTAILSMKLLLALQDKEIIEITFITYKLCVRSYKMLGLQEHKDTFSLLVDTLRYEQRYSIEF